MIGNVVKNIDTEQYKVYIKDERGIKEEIILYGIENISKSATNVCIEEIAMKLFPYIERTRLRYPSEGETDILIGMQYAAFHPTRIDNRDHLLLTENRFGYAISGSHALIEKYPQKIVQHAVVLNTATTIDALYTIENLGVSCTPKCGSCRCGKCHLGGKTYL